MIIPLISHLHILQLEQYSYSRYLNWYLQNPAPLSSVSSKVPLKTTSKIRILLALSLFYFLLFSAYFLIQKLYLLVLIFTILSFFLPSFLLTPAFFTLLPLDQLIRLLTLYRIQNLLSSYRRLITIGITGSFGKTSTKNYLYQILDTYKNSLKTPNSYNTLLGIAKVIDLELTNSVRYFICEMAAYKRGEIRELCRMVPPKYAILTAVGTQHLERFGDLTNTTLAKFELIDSVSPHNAIVNIDNELIYNHLRGNPKKYAGILTYSLSNPTADFYLKKYKFTSDGVEFVLHHRHRDYHFFASVFGSVNLENLVSAISMSLLLQIPLDIIRKSVSCLQAAPNRLELKKINQAVVIDNTYSSNVTGFNRILDDLSTLAAPKAIVTPGIVELGKTSAEVHLDLGKRLAGIFDEIILVGRTSRTKKLEEGIKAVNSKTAVSYLNDHQNYWSKVNELSRKYSWILLENDLPDNYL